MTNASTADVQPVLELEDVSIAFPINRKPVTVVQSATLSVGPGKIVGLVGESGSGKTVTAMASTGLLRTLGGRVTGGTIKFQGRDVTNLSERAWTKIRGDEIGVVFQNPIRCLNPAYTIGDQIAEGVREHRGLSRKAAWARAVEMLERVGIARAKERARDYPHQFSGGMCQRVAIAIALACEPKLLIADEPTTALDVTVQLHILDLILELRDSLNIGVLFITHDLGVVAHTCDEVAVMYAGQVVERGDIEPVFAAPTHPYTEGLLGALPKLGTLGLPSAIPGTVPPPDDMPEGCRFAPRCKYVEEKCRAQPMQLRQLSARSYSRCIHPWEESPA